MNWQEVCEDQSLQNLPYKIELNERGKIEMSPARSKHSIFQGKIIKYFVKILIDTGSAFPEFPIQTSKGVKVADVVWMSDDFYEEQKNYDVLVIAPEICVEVISPSNTQEEMEEKRQLYLEKGAKEFWICNEDGNMEFYGSNGKIDKSAIVPDFPDTIEF